MKKLALAFLAMMSLAGCSQNSEPIKQDVYGYKLPKYGSLFVQFEWATISVRGFTDSITFESWRFRDSATAKGVIYRVPINRKIKKSKINQSEKDSMFQWMNTLVSKPVRPLKSCSDYVGKVKFIIMRDQATQSCAYNSVCEWDSINTESQKLSKLFKVKFKDF